MINCVFVAGNPKEGMSRLTTFKYIPSSPALSYAYGANHNARICCSQEKVGIPNLWSRLWRQKRKTSPCHACRRGRRAMVMPHSGNCREGVVWRSLYNFSHQSCHAKRYAWKDAAVFDFNCPSRVVSQPVFAPEALQFLRAMHSRSQRCDKPQRQR